MPIKKEKPQQDLLVKDHSVSGETFKLIHDKNRDMLITSPQPLAENLSNYYKSDDYISHTNSKKNIIEVIYHFVRSFAMRRKLNLINEYSETSKDLLDIGCGTGDFLEMAESNGWNVSGIEPNEKARKIANSKTKKTVIANIDTLLISNQRFNIITLWHVLEHLPNLEDQILKIKSLLKEDGTIILAVPNYNSYDAKYYKSFWAAYDTPRHLWHFSKNSINIIFKEFEMKVTSVIPMKFDSYYVSLLSEKYKNGNAFSLNAIYRGWLSNFKAGTNGEYSSLIYVLRNIKHLNKAI